MKVCKLTTFYCVNIWILKLQRESQWEIVNMKQGNTISLDDDREHCLQGFLVPVAGGR